MDTGPKLNRITEACLRLHFNSCIKLVDAPKLRAPTKESIIPIMGRNEDLSKISIILSHKVFSLDTQEHAPIQVVNS